MNEGFDHWIRTQQEFDKTVRYIENNPIKAGLVKNPEDWEWSSASILTSALESKARTIRPEMTYK